MNPPHKVDCLFCQYAASNRMVVEYGSVFAILDKYPVTEGHHLVVTKRHVVDYFAMSYNEKRDAEALLSLLKRRRRLKQVLCPSVHQSF
jgi:diadenosine tetraphosphate (Ap4A) HIT family hydrolase